MWGKALVEGLYLLANLPPRKGRQKDQPKWSTWWENAYQFQLFLYAPRLARNFVTNLCIDSHNGPRPGSSQYGLRPLVHLHGPAN